jgi:tetraacyldisaccharide 4'-kinase
MPGGPRSLSDPLRALFARRLERGDASLPARAASSLWALLSAPALARPLRLPPGVRLLGIGSAVLGGAGKTPLAVALVRALSALDHGQRPALIGHAYRASPPGPRLVLPTDAVSLVGDDALAAARLLSGAAPVFVAPRRQAAVDHAAALGHRLLVADGLLQTAPHRLAASILVLDALSPWGSGACPPAGDLRAPRAALLSAADHLAVLLPAGSTLDPALSALGAIPIPSHLAGALTFAGELLPLAALAALRLGVLLTVARPARVLAALSRAGLFPTVTIRLADHASPTPRDLSAAAREPVDAWVTTARCATKLPARLGAAPVLVLDHRLEIAALLAALGRTGTGG